MTEFEQTTRFAGINVNSAGNNVIVPAPGVGKRIRVDMINFIPSGTCNPYFTDNGNPFPANVTPLPPGVVTMGAYPMAAHQGFVIENVTHDEKGVMEMSDNGSFGLFLDVPVQVSGFIKYRIYNE